MELNAGMQITKMPDFADLKKDATTLMKECAFFALLSVQKNIDSRIAPQNAPLTQAVKRNALTLRDTGKLRSGIHATHSEREAIVSTNSSYAAAVHDGATVRPSRAKYLCIPASAYTRTLFRRYGWSVREVIAGLEADGASVYRPYKRGSSSNRANVIIATKEVKKNGERKKPRVIFILRREVKIPARPFMFLNDEALAAIDKAFSDFYAGGEA